MQKSSCSIFADDLEISGENRRQLEESGMKACSEEESCESVDVQNRGGQNGGTAVKLHVAEAFKVVDSPRVNHPV